MTTVASRTGRALALVLGVVLLAPAARGDDKDKAGWKSLFDGKTLDGWKTTKFLGTGKVSVKDGAVVMEKGRKMTGITYDRRDFPRTNYEVSFEGKKIDGDDFFCTTTFPVGDDHCSLVVGGWGGSLVGLSSVDFQDASQNETTKYVEFKANQWYRVRVRVTADKIEAWIDDEKMVDLETKDRKISLRIECEPCKPFGLATYDTVGAVRNLRVRTLGAAPKADAAPLVKTTHTFKTAGDVRIEADVYRPDDAVTRPVVVYLHGGALIGGSRTAVPGNLLDLCRREGFALVSFDYRLAPEVKLPAIISDVLDGFRWLRGQGPRLLHLDPQRVVVTGGSAGGYLTLMTGFRVKPRPVALVSYWGYGDVDGDWYTKPSEHYRTSSPLVKEDEARAGVGGPVLTGVTRGNDAQKARSRYYLFLRQNGLWTREVTGFDPVADRAKLDPYCPVRNVTPDYPPTMLVHGTADTDVPYDLSEAMAKELARHKVAHELVRVDGAGHGLTPGDKKLADDAHQKALAFIRKHLKSEGPPKQ